MPALALLAATSNIASIAITLRVAMLAAFDALRRLVLCLTFLLVSPTFFSNNGKAGVANAQYILGLGKLLTSMIREILLRLIVSWDRDWRYHWVSHLCV